MNKGFVLGVGLTSLLFGGLILGYYSGFFSKFTQDRVTRFSEKCLDIHRSAFRDPNSAYVNGAQFSLINENVILVDVRAKNGFGGYGSQSIECLVSGGRVSRN